MSYEENFNAWKQVLDTPEGMAALMAFSTQMLQPTSRGFTGALGQSIGAAGEAANRVGENKQKQALLAQDTAQREFEKQATMRQLGQGDRQLDISQQNADAAMLNAKRPAAGTAGLSYADRVKMTFEAMQDAYKATVENASLSGQDPGPAPTLQDAEREVQMGEARGKLTREGFTPDTITALRNAGVPEENITNAIRIAKGAGLFTPGEPGAPAPAESPPRISGESPSKPAMPGDRIPPVWLTNPRANRYQR